MIKKKLLASLTSSLFFLAILFSFFYTIYINIDLYQNRFSSNKLSRLYNYSQFAQESQDRKLIIQDHDLYAYAGWYYLKTGELDQINIEHPPLGKYLIGFSTFIFENQNIGQIFWAILFLFLLYKLSQKVLKKTSLSLLVVLLFSQEKLFKEQLTHSLLDVFLGVFLLIFFLITLSSERKKEKLILLIQGISLGIISSIKYPTIALVSFITLVVYYAFKKERRAIKKLFFIALLSLGIFLLSYLPFFIKNPQPLSFYNFQVKALKIHLSHVPEYPKGQVFNVLFFNRWLSWWGEKNYIKTEFWNFLWPILTLNFLLSLFKFKKNLLINLWTLFYLIFLCLRLFFPRYLFLLLPFLYLSLCYNLKSLLNFLILKK